MSDRHALGLFIKERRTIKGLTLRKASELLGYKSIGTLANLELGTGPLPVEKIHPIANILGIDVDELKKKIKECEPELYEKYMTLENDIEEHLIRKMRGYANVHRPELRLHHHPFSSPLPWEGIGLHNCFYREPNYILSE